LPEITPKTISHGNERKLIPKFRETVQTQVKFHHQFHFTSTFSSVSYEVQHLFLMFGVATNDSFFEKIFKTVIQKFAMRCK